MMNWFACVICRKGTYRSRLGSPPGWLRGLLFGVSAFDPLTLAAVAALFILVALVACLVPAQRAARVDPLSALRGE
jgi:ABC-type antimicrobial peptide transport system permease subunit